ncbi:unnamed protein product [Gordionus sp. m RMFG-2023]|uniref:caspase-3-like n=1 Tax=Gordionus sp. m RMFG-2023 TaxID=3053472 RepID=UPI0030E56ECB
MIGDNIEVYNIEKDGKGSNDNQDSFLKFNETLIKKSEYSLRNHVIIAANNGYQNLIDSDVYNFSHRNRGKAIIVNNRDFENNTGLNTRTGTDKDALCIRDSLIHLGFDVSLHHNLSAKNIMHLINLVSQGDFRDDDCFVFIIMSHGEEGYLWGTDDTFKLEQLTSCFRGDVCKTLAGKPKLFFVQACRGTRLDDGVEATDGYDVTDSKVIKKIPVESDFLIAYSVVPGYFSWRNCSEGSWFIQSLCKALDKYSHKLDLLRILTRVNRMVGEYTSNTNDPDWHDKMQSPSIVSMLTKDLYFHYPSFP